ncbi:hypothetical protein AAG570_010980 [Ranatra chinensis]|uniref:Uncharacterized protein n=1 Tax=Ranatra chinensis TaxID=642074 RepID=A0ABD0Z5L3_9HEMI
MEWVGKNIPSKGHQQVLGHTTVERAASAEVGELACCDGISKLTNFDHYEPRSTQLADGYAIADLTIEPASISKGRPIWKSTDAFYLDGVNDHFHSFQEHTGQYLCLVPSNKLISMRRLRHDPGPFDHE